MSKKSKRYREAKAMVDRLKYYRLDEAIDLLKKFPPPKFDETVELHFRLGVNPKKADQNIRNFVILPNGTGKKAKVMVFAEGELAEKAKQAGADYVGLEDYIEKINEGWLDFDVAIAVPRVMRLVGKLGRILGPRGKMPNPKEGTVTNDVEKAVRDAHGGKVTYKVDKTGNIHMPVGKVSYDQDKLKENVLVAVNAILKDKPPTVKGVYMKSLTLATTMNPGIKLDVAEATLEAKK